MADGCMGVQYVDIATLSTAVDRHKSVIEKRATKENWPFETRAVRGGQKRFYRVTSLPIEVQAALQRAAAIKAAEKTKLSPAFAEGMVHARRGEVAAAVTAAVQKRQREQGTAAAAGLTGRSAERMEAKLELLQRLSAFAQELGQGVTRATELFCDAYNSGRLTVPVNVRHFTGACLHPATLRKWRAAVKKRGAAALAGDYGNRKGQTVIDTQPDVRDFVIGLLAAKPHASGKVIWDAIDARFGSKGYKMPDLRSVQRWLAAWKRDNAEVFLAATNPDAWKNRHMAAFGSLTENITRACQLWQLDSTPADLQLEDGRYSLVGVIDLAWRGLRLYVTRTSTADAVCRVMRRAILEWGVPEAIKIDNGRDYASARVAGLVTALHIEPRFSAPFSPWEKGNIERAFRTFAHNLFEMLPGYIGHSVAEAQAIRAREAFSDRLFKKNEVVEVKLTAAELQDFCDRWCLHYYQHESHDGLGGQTPFQRYAQLRDVVPRIQDVRALDLLLGAGDMRTVTKKGLRIDNLVYIAPELAGVIGQRVLVRRDDEGDLGRVVVYHADRFLCVAECPEVLGVSRREIAIEAKARQTKGIQEAKAQLRAAKKKANVADMAWEILQRREDLHGNVTSLPAPNVVHMTPALEAAGEAADALERPVNPLDALGPTTEAHVAQVMQMLRDERTADETNVTRFGRALRAMAAPDNQIEQQWLKGYRQSSEFRGNWMVFEEFGAGAFQLGDEFNALLPGDAPYHQQKQGVF